MTDVLIVGGGVIGLSLAYELAGHGLVVRVIDAGQPGQEASWAGAGILPPSCATTVDPLEQLAALSNQVHRHWSDELRAMTGIDNGYRRCGAIYLEREADAAARLDQFAGLAHARGIVADHVAGELLSRHEPALLPDTAVRTAYLVPDECQIRNPRHLKALIIACAGRGVEITPGAGAEDFDVRGGRICAVRTSRGSLSAEQVCLAAGSWTSVVADRLGMSPAMKPVRGQMVLFNASRPVLTRIVNEGCRYLVPRGDGRLLAGSTEEDVGFDRSTTVGGVQGLLNFATGLVPELAGATIERTWAGLRPATADGVPYLGRLPGLENAWIAAGHFRGGLQLSTGTAVVMSQLLRGKRPDVDLTPFRVDRARSDPAPRPSARPHRRIVPQR